MEEIHNYALIVLVVAGGLSIAVLFTKLSDVIPVPAPLVFLLAAALAAAASSDIAGALDPRDVERLSVGALIIILLNGGLDIGLHRMRASAGAVLSLGILGTFATAAVTAAGARFVLGFDWVTAGLLGAALAPTDPAVMFSVLRGRELRGRSQTVLEGEAGFNDPAGIALMIGMIELAMHPDATFWVVVTDFLKEMSLGTVFGVAGAWLLTRGLRRIRLGEDPLYPVLVLLLAGVLYGVTGLMGGSGFLAVFLAGLVLADHADVHQREAIRSAAGLSEIVVFVALGLTIGIADLPGSVWLDGVILAAIVAIVARPLVVAVLLSRSDLSAREQAFIAWSGLKGAVPIVLAVFALISGVEGGRELYGIVFVVVALSVAVQGSLVPAVASRLDVAAER